MSEQIMQNKLMQDIQDEIKLFCQTGIWSKDWQDVQCWLSNFKDNHNHYYFAHLLLDKIVFRTNKMIESSYRRFLATAVREKVNEVSASKYSVSEFFSALKSGQNAIHSHFRVTSITTGEKAESGEALIRHINSSLINTSLNLNNEESRRECQKLSNDYVLLIIDDFLGSGEQATNFFNSYIVGQQDSAFFEKHESLIFAPAVAMSNGLEDFRLKFPAIETLPLELVLPHHNVFDGDLKKPFGRDANFTKEQALHCYEDIKKTYKIKLKDWLGRDKSGLPLIFQLGVPNQSLGVIFHQCENWYHLQTRRAS